MDRPFGCRNMNVVTRNTHREANSPNASNSLTPVVPILNYTFAVQLKRSIGMSDQAGNLHRRRCLSASTRCREPAHGGNGGQAGLTSRICSVRPLSSAQASSVYVNKTRKLPNGVIYTSLAMAVMEGPWVHQDVHTSAEESSPAI